jgi:hypothetical protein
MQSKYRPCRQCGDPVKLRQRQFCGPRCIAEWRVAHIAARFWAKVHKDGPVIRPELGPCWVWTAGCTSAGYGQFGIGPTVFYAHRLSYQWAIGPIPDGLNICHRCDNPPCVRPDHLFPGDDAINLADMRSKGRAVFPPRELAPRGEQHYGSKLNAESVKVIRSEYARGDISQAALAKRFGLSRSSVEDVLHRRTWKSVP